MCKEVKKIKLIHLVALLTKKLSVAFSFTVAELVNLSIKTMA